MMGGGALQGIKTVDLHFIFKENLQKNPKILSQNQHKDATAFSKGKRRISTKKIPSPLSKFLLFILKNKIGKKKVLVNCWSLQCPPKMLDTNIV